VIRLLLRLFYQILVQKLVTLASAVLFKVIEGNLGSSEGSLFTFLTVPSKSLTWKILLSPNLIFQESTKSYSSEIRLELRQNYQILGQKLVTLASAVLFKAIEGNLGGSQGYLFTFLLVPSKTLKWYILLSPAPRCWLATASHSSEIRLDLRLYYQILGQKLVTSASVMLLRVVAGHLGYYWGYLFTFLNVLSETLK
jgi:hypothetical protein